MKALIKKYLENELIGLMEEHSCYKEQTPCPQTVQTKTDVIRSEDITAFDKRTKNFGKTGLVAHYKAQKHGGLLKAPWNLEICPTSRCPFSCSFCSYSSRNQRKYELETSQIFGILEDAKAMGVVGTYLSGGGEPLMHQSILEIIERAATFSEVFIQTNGYHLNKLLARGDCWFKDCVDLISLSVYGHCQKQYEKMGVVPKNAFKKIRENLERAAEVGVHISCKIILCQDNYYVIDDMLQLAKNLGANTIHVRPVSNYEPGQNVELSRTQLHEAAELISPVNSQISTFLKNLSHSSSNAGNVPCFTTKEGHTAIVETDGNVYLCIPTDGYSDYSIGNINKNRFRDIWSSKQHHKVIQKLQRAFVCDPKKCRHFKINSAIQEYEDGGNISISLDELFPYGAI